MHLRNILVCGGLLAVAADLSGCHAVAATAHRPMADVVSPQSVVVPDRGVHVYLVLLEGEPLALHHREVTSVGVLDASSPGAREYLTHLRVQHQQALAKIDQALGRRVVPLYDYYYASNGMALKLTPTEAARVVRLPGVRSVMKDVAHPPLPGSSRPQ